MAADDRLYADPDLARFYDLDNTRDPADDWCARFAAGARSILDLGCGTGRLAAALTAGHVVVGVDPAAAMTAPGPEPDVEYSRRADIIGTNVNTEAAGSNAAGRRRYAPAAADRMRVGAVASSLATARRCSSGTPPSGQLP